MQAQDPQPAERLGPAGGRERHRGRGQAERHRGVGAERRPVLGARAERVLDRREAVEAGVEAGQLEQLALLGGQRGERQARVAVKPLVEADEHAESHRIHVGELGEVEHVVAVALVEQVDQGELQLRGGGQVEIALDRNDEVCSSTSR